MSGGGVGWQLTTLLRRAAAAASLGLAARAVAQGDRPGARPGLRPVEEPGSGGDLRLEVATEMRRDLAGAALAELDTLLAASGDADTRLVVERTLAATGSVDTAARMAQAWADLPDPTRRAVLDPIGVLAHEGRQSDQTTCGSSALSMLAAAGDPSLALWLATGRLVSPAPEELSGAPLSALAALELAPPEARFAAVQRVIKRRSNSGAALGLPWPSALGTPPWGAARVARFPGVRFHQRMLDDTDAADLRSVLAAVGAWVDRGVPVPLYSGGDTAGGWSTAVPRHVVVAIGRSGSDLELWEPSVGAVQTVGVERLVASTAPLPALGGWSHLMWAVLPYRWRPRHP